MRKNEPVIYVHLTPPVQDFAESTRGVIMTIPRASTSRPKLLPGVACWVHTRPMDFTSHFIGKCNYERCLSRGEKSLVPGVRLIMASYWSGQRAPAMSSRPVRARYVSRSTGLMVFMMVRINRPVRVSPPSLATRPCCSTVREI